jgi:hypothetical protein
MSLPAPPTEEERAQPGFAVWMVTAIRGSGFSATDAGYPGTPTVEAVLDVTDKLLRTSPPLRPTQ